MKYNPFITQTEQVATTPHVADEIKKTTCYMCACRCGIKVYLKDGTVRYIEGNPDHPVNRGVLCAKGSAGIMNHYSPARLSTPLLRVGERGSGEFKEISWHEAMEIATNWLAETRAKDPSKLAFFTGRDQSQSLTGWWASQYGTHNFAAHGGFCSVNMAAAGLYSVGGAFWEFGEPDWDNTRYFMLFGVAEDHDSNPIKIGLGKIKARDNTKFVSINPVRTGYSAIADEWLGVRPGTDGLFILSLIHQLLKKQKIDTQYLLRYTNAAWLVYQAPGEAHDGIFVRDGQGKPLVFKIRTNKVCRWDEPGVIPKIDDTVTLPDGSQAVTVLSLLTHRYLHETYAPERVAPVVGISAQTIERIADEIADIAFSQEITIDQPWTDWQGRTHQQVTGRPISMHAMRGISAHSNGFQTCRALHVLQMLLGSIDVPGGWRYKAPFPKPIPPQPRPAMASGEANTALAGVPIGNPQGPADLVVDEQGKPKRIDKAYSWEHPIACHGLMHMVLHNAWAGDPYPVDIVFMYMSNMAWNSSMNTAQTINYFTDKDENGEYKIPKFIYADAYYSETVAYADLVLPDTTYLERHDCMSLLDRPISSAHGPADAIRVPVVEPDRDVRSFQSVLLDLGARLGLPALVKEDGTPRYPNGYADYLVNHERSPGIGPLAGWRGDGTQHGCGAPNPQQLERYIENGCFWQDHLAPEAQYMRFANKAYLDYAKHMGWIEKTDPIVFQIYSEPLQKFRLAGLGLGEHPAPQVHRKRLQTYFDPLPFWYEPFEETFVDQSRFPLHALTQRPMHMYHSWGSQNAWLRQITNSNFLYIHADLAAKHNLADGDWVWIESHHSKIRAPITIMQGTNKDTVWTWNAIGKRRGSWGLDDNVPESNKGFLLNHLISELLPKQKDQYQYANSDPITGQAAWFDLRVQIRKCTEQTQISWPQFTPLPQRRLSHTSTLQFGKQLRGTPTAKSPSSMKEWVARITKRGV